MNPFLVLLVLLSAFMHAGWNLLARHQKAEDVFFARILMIVALVGLVPAGLSELLTHSLTAKSFACAAGSGLCFGFYFFFLARAYASADFTSVYPIARALPVLFIALGDVARARYPSAIGWVAILLVTSGLLLAPLESFGDFNHRRYLRRRMLWVILTAVATVGFTMFDKIGSESLRFSGPATAARYGYALYFVSCVSYLALNAFFGERRRDTTGISWRTPILGALLTFGGYWLVLWAYQLTTRASYVFAFRQFSVVIAVALAFHIYREKGLFVRLTGTALITAGLVLIAIWGK